MDYVFYMRIVWLVVEGNDRKKRFLSRIIRQRFNALIVSENQPGGT